MWIAVILFLLAVVIFGFWWFKRSKSITKDANQVSQDEQPAKDDEIAISSLLDINLTLRKNRPPVPLLEKYEELIDQLIEILPVINNEYPDGDLTWSVNRIATKYLPEKSVLPYLGLDLEKRKDREVIEKTIEGIDLMMNELKEIFDLLSKRKTSEFSSKAKFLKQRFDM
jgi:hypothetical protein